MYGRVRIDTNRMRYTVTETWSLCMEIGQPITSEESKEYSSRECMGRGPLDTTSKATLDARGEGVGPIYTTLRIRFPWENEPSRKDLPYWKREKVVVAGGWNSVREGLLKPRTPPLVFMIRASSLDNLRLPTIPTNLSARPSIRAYVRGEGGRVLIYLINSATLPFILDAPPRLDSWGGKRASKGINAARRV